MPARKNTVKYVKNPFMQSALAHTVQGNRVITGKEDNTRMIVNRDTGEVEGITGFYQRITVDRTSFLKVYAQGIRALLGLKPAGMKVFIIVYDEMLDDRNYQKDQIVLNYEMLEDDIKESMSKATFFRGISQLIEGNILAESPIRGMYWINVDYIYRGNRLALCKEYVMEEAKEVDPTTYKPKKINVTNDVSDVSIDVYIPHAPAM